MLDQTTKNEVFGDGSGVSGIIGDLMRGMVMSTFGDDIESETWIDRDYRIKERDNLDTVVKLVG